MAAVWKCIYYTATEAIKLPTCVRWLERLVAVERDISPDAAWFQAARLLELNNEGGGLDHTIYSPSKHIAVVLAKRDRRDQSRFYRELFLWQRREAGDYNGCERSISRILDLSPSIVNIKKTINCLKRNVIPGPWTRQTDSLIVVVHETRCSKITNSPKR